MLKFLFQGIKFFFQGLVGVKPLNLFSRGCKFFSRAYPLEPPKASLSQRFPEQLCESVPEATTRHHTRVKPAGTETVATVASVQEGAKTSGKLHEM